MAVSRATSRCGLLWSRTRHLPRRITLYLTQSKTRRQNEAENKATSRDRTPSADFRRRPQLLARRWHRDGAGDENRAVSNTDMGLPTAANPPRLLGELDGSEGARTFPHRLATSQQKYQITVYRMVQARERPLSEIAAACAAALKPLNSSAGQPASLGREPRSLAPTATTTQTPAALFPVRLPQQVRSVTRFRRQQMRSSDTNEV